MSLHPVLGASLAILALGLGATQAAAQDKQVRIGVIYDYTGPFAAGGSEAAAIGTRPRST
jgi:branched-chain amino acid transport system substrate-binding protein